MLHGVDISNNNGVISLRSVGNIDFAIAKASQGTTFVDPDFGIFWDMMKEDGLLRGAYHFLTTSDPTAQAKFFIECVAKHGIEEGDILVADIEQAGLTNAQIRIFVNEVTNRTGKNVFVYTEYSFINEGLVNGLFNHPLWIANPGGHIGNPPSVHPFPVWSIQQYDWHTIDKNVFNGAETEWKQLANMGHKPILSHFVTQGHENMHQISERLGCGVSTMLRLSAENTNDRKEFSHKQAEFINNIFSGKLAWHEPVPAGITLYYAKS